jgi:hypothetical protein
VKIKVCAVLLSAIAAATLTSGVAAATPVPQGNGGICNTSLAMWQGAGPGGVGKTINVSGDIQYCGSTTWTPAYLVLFRVTGGEQQWVADGVEEATYLCQGTTPNLYEAEGQTGGILFTTQANCT